MKARDIGVGIADFQIVIPMSMPYGTLRPMLMEMAVESAIPEKPLLSALPLVQSPI